MHPAIEVVEVGPRDGLQNEARALDVDTRVEFISRLVDRGVRRLEAVSFVRPDRVPQMAGAEEVMAGVPARADVTYIGLVLNRRGAERAAQTACNEINIVVPVTDDFSVRNQNATIDQMIGHATAATAVARDAGMSVSVTLAVAFGCPFTGRVTTEQVAKVLHKIADLGVDEIAYADTIGVGVPSQVCALAGLAAGDNRIRRLRFHFHNTRNTGYANAYAASRLDMEALPGTAIALDSSVGGFGGCPFAPAATGNVATEDLLYLLRQNGAVLEPHGLDVTSLAEIGSWLSIQLDKPPEGLLGRAGDFHPNPQPEEQQSREHSPLPGRSA